MKRENFIKTKQKTLILTLICLALLSASCRKSNQVVEPDIETGLYVLNEGMFNFNNASITYYDFKMGITTADIFLKANGRYLGSVGNDLKQYGSKLYCVVNMSEQLEIIDPQNGKSIKNISLNGKQPRCIVSHQGKVYISCFDGYIVKIDTVTLQIEGQVRAGRNPEGICVANNKLYVANSGGLDYPNYNNTVSVINLSSFQVFKTITVGTGPVIVKTDYHGNVYVALRGNYIDIPPAFQKINTQTDEMVKDYQLQVIGFDISGNEAYIYHYDFYNYTSWIKILDLVSGNIIKENFITDDTKIKTPYGIIVDPKTGDVYITDAGDFRSNGDVYCFNKSGRKKFQFEAGINPSGNIVFKN